MDIKLPKFSIKVMTIHTKAVHDIQQAVKNKFPEILPTRAFHISYQLFVKWAFVSKVKCDLNLMRYKGKTKGKIQFISQPLVMVQIPMASNTTA